MWYLQNVMGMVSRIDLMSLPPPDIFFFGAIKATKVILQVVKSKNGC
jgi:hypothetical protein